MQNRLPIVRTSGLFYRDYGHADAERFVRLFREVWKAIPMRDRKIMVRHWQGQKAECCAGWPSEMAKMITFPKIEVLGYPPDFEQCFGIAYAGLFGNEPRLAFWSFAVNQMPDLVIKTVIAHELGHAYFYATGAESHSVEAQGQESIDAEIRACIIARHKAGEELTEGEKFLASLPDASELDVNELICDWGFYEDDVDAWGEANRDAIETAAKAAIE